MNCPDSFSLQSRWSARLQAVLEIVMVSSVVSGFLVSMVLAAVFGRSRLNMAEMNVEFFTMYQLSGAAVTFLILWILMKGRGETLAGLGMNGKQWKSNVLLGILAVPCLVVLSVWIITTFRSFLPEYALEKNPLTEMINSPKQLALFVITVIVAGGIQEEIQRAFILCRFRSHLGGAWVGLVVWSLVFGAGHYVQGAQGVLAATVLGFVFGALYLIRGNLILPMIAHAGYNTLTVFIYWFTIGINK